MTENNRQLVEHDDYSQVVDFGQRGLYELPGAGVCDEPLVSVCLNASWWRVVKSVIHLLLNREAWRPGTDMYIVEDAILRISEAEMSCGGGDCGCAAEITQLKIIAQAALNYSRIDYNVANNIDVANYTTNEGDVVYNYNEYNEQSVPDAAYSQDAAPADATCDQLYAAAVAFVDSLVDALQNYYAAVEVSGNESEFVAQYVDLIPGLGAVADELFFTDILQVLTLLNRVPGELFDAEFTPELRDDLICDVFCEFVATGKSSIKVAEGVIARLYNEAPNPVSLSAIADYMFGQNPVGATAVYEPMWAYLNSNKFTGGYGLLENRAAPLRIQQRMEAAALDGDPGWQTLCDGCVNWVEVFDFSNPDDIARVNIGIGSATGVGVMTAETSFPTAKLLQGSTFRNKQIALHINIPFYQPNVGVITWRIGRFEYEIYDQKSRTNTEDIFVGTAMFTSGREAPSDDKDARQGETFGDVDPVRAPGKIHAFEYPTNQNINGRFSNDSLDFPPKSVNLGVIVDTREGDDPVDPTNFSIMRRLRIVGTGTNPFRESTTTC